MSIVILLIFRRRKHVDYHVYFQHLNDGNSFPAENLYIGRTCRLSCLRVSAVTNRNSISHAAWIAWLIYVKHVELV